VLARAGLGDDALLAHAPGQQALAEGVVDFVRSGVQQVFALQVNPGPAQLFGEPLAEGERRRPAGVILQQRVQFSVKDRIGLGQVVLALQLVQRRHQRLRHIPPAINAKAAGLRLGWKCGIFDRCHEGPPACLGKKMILFSVQGASV
jgi:hypothetical protein